MGKYKGLIITFFLILAAACFRFLSLKTGFTAVDIGLDGEWYLGVAKSILAGKGFSYNGMPTAYTVPVYPIFISLAQKVLGPGVSSIISVQLVIGSINSALVFMVARRIFGLRSAVLSGVITAIYYFFAKCESSVLTEAIFMPLVTLSVLWMVKLYFDGRKSILNIFIFGIICAVCTLTRSAFFLFPAFIAAIDFIFKIGIFGGNNSIKKAKKAIIYLLIFFMPIAGWAYRNYKVFNEFIPLATEAGHVLYFSYHPKDGKIFGMAYPDKVSKEILKNPSEAEQSRMFVKATIKDIKSDPKLTVRYLFLKNMFFWSLFDWEILGNQGVYNFSTGFIMLFFIISIFMVIRDKFKNAVLIFIPILYTYITSMMFMGLPRNRYTIEQFMIILSAYALIKLYDIIKRKWAYLTGVFLWAGLNYLFFLNSGAVKVFFREMFSKINLW